MTVKELYDSGEYNIVVKLVTSDGEALAARLKRMLGGSKVSLAELVGKAVDTGMVRDVRVSVSFAPVNWYSIESWGVYSWPYKTLASYGLDNVRGMAVRADSELARALLALYKGFGIVALERRGVGETAVPALVLLDERREPKRNVILFVWGDPRGYLVTAVTSTPSIIPALEEHGYMLLSRQEPAPGFEVYELAHNRIYRSLSELEEHARRLRDALAGLGYTVYLHVTGESRRTELRLPRAQEVRA